MDTIIAKETAWLFVGPKLNSRKGSLTSIDDFVLSAPEVGEGPMGLLGEKAAETSLFFPLSFPSCMMPPL